MNDHPKQPKWKHQPDEDGWWWAKAEEGPPFIIYVNGGKAMMPNPPPVEFMGPLEPPSCFQDYPE